MRGKLKHGETGTRVSLLTALEPIVDETDDRRSREKGFGVEFD